MNAARPEPAGTRHDDDLLQQAEKIVDANFHSAEQAQQQRLAQHINGNAASKLIWAADELLTVQFSDPVWIVPNLIPSGLTILAGRPKVGKSWLALQIAIAVATAGTVLGENVAKRRVLYLALEDSARRLQNRLALQKCPPGASFDLVTKWRPLIDDGVDILIKTITARHYQFVVVDTLARFAAVRKADDENLVTKRLAELQQFTGESNIGCLLIDHHRKPAAGVSDLIDDIMGPTGKAAIADAALGVYRARGQQAAELKLTGRDVTERELAVHFDLQLHCWQLLGNADDVRAGTLQGQILAIIRSEYGGMATCAQVAKSLGKDRANAYREIQELCNKLRLVRTGEKAGREVYYKMVGT